MKWLFFLLLALSAISSSAQTRVLFIGNSYTYVNGLPSLIQSLATIGGKTMVVDSALVGGYTFQNHSTDPTTLNKQGADEGTQYRSVIFYRNEEQKKVAEDIKQGLDKSGAFDKPIVTEISAYDMFWKAEDYHQDYYNQNKNSNSYCAYVIVPKIEKFEQYFKDKIKKQ